MFHGLWLPHSDPDSTTVWGQDSARSSGWPGDGHCLHNPSFRKDDIKRNWEKMLYHGIGLRFGTDGSQQSVNVE